MKVSFCITCMGRLHHLKQTLPKNIADNANCDVEFVILDYNSQDGLKDWVQRTFGNEISSGLITYWEEKTAKFYNSSRAKNISHVVATGDILCSLDADCFTGRQPVRTLEEIFEKNLRSFVRQKTNCGWLILRKEAFHQLRGYDESFTGWGYDDLDLARRASEAGLEEVNFVPEGSYRIDHSDEERMQNFEDKRHPYATNADNIARANSRVPGTIINPSGYGIATLYKNFSLEPVHVGCK